MSQWILLGFLAAFTFGPSAEGAVRELKVMSFNIWVSGGRSLSNCAAAIRVSGADIVGLQECKPEAGAWLAKTLGYHVTSHPGIPILSRYPIVQSLRVEGGSGAIIELAPGQQVNFFNCHLNPYPYGPYTLRETARKEKALEHERSARMPALTKLLEAMKPYLAGKSPCFLTGDFNAPSHFDYVDLPWPTSLACIQAGLEDSYHLMNPQRRKYPGPFAFNEPGVTWTPIVNEEPNGVYDRIDFVYVSSGDGVVVLRSEALDERNCVKPWPSDHRAVLSQVRLPTT